MPENILEKILNVKKKKIEILKNTIRLESILD